MVFLSLTGLVASLGASVFLHQAPLLLEPLVCLVLGALVTAAVRVSWADLPPFVTSWLDAGTLIVAIWVAVPSTLVVRPLPYTVLVWPRAAGLLFAAAVLGLLIAGLALTHRRLEQKVRAQTERIAAAEQAAASSRLTALSAQINPHFLFNTLNTLAEVVHEDEDEAEDLIADLAKLMRYALEHSTRRVTVAQELDVIRRLLRIEAARLGERLQTEVVLDEAASQALIPGLLVQPLVENAVKHGVATRIEGGRVEVRASVRDDRLLLEVLDDGPGLTERPTAEGTEPDSPDHAGGLSNVRERVRLAWPDQLTRVHVTGPGTHITLDLPLERP